MVSGLLGIAIFVVIIFMSTLGSVLLVQFIVPKLSRGKRILVAALIGPALLLLPVTAVILVDNPSDALVGLFGVSIMGLVMSGIVGWPTAHFATKRLDRMTKFDLETFK